METRTLFGLQLAQKRNNAVIDRTHFDNVITKRNEVSTLLYEAGLCYFQHLESREESKKSESKLK